MPKSALEKERFPSVSHCIGRLITVKKVVFRRVTWLCRGRSNVGKQEKQKGCGHLVTGRQSESAQPAGDLSVACGH